MENEVGSGDRGKTRSSGRWEGILKSSEGKLTLPFSHDLALLILTAFATLQQLKQSSYLEILFMLGAYKSM